MMPDVHLSKLPSGTWRVAVKHEGERRTATARTRAEAQRLGAELLMEMGGSPRAQPTVRELLDAHIAAQDLAATTRSSYLRVRDALPEVFLERKVRAVTPPIIEALYRQLAATGLRQWSPHSLQRLHAVLSGAWQRAMGYEWATRNPVRVVSAPTSTTHEIAPPTPEQVARLIAGADPTFAVFLRLAASTGARRSELVALQWVDIDFDRAQVSISRSLAYTAAAGVHIRPTKTGSRGHRQIALGLPTTTALRRLHIEQRELAMSSGAPPPVWAFSSSAGALPWFPDWPTKAFTEVRRKAGCETVRLHDLRHFVATQMLVSGRSVAQVAARLGQTQAATTHRYSHWIKAVDQEAADDLEALIV